MNPNRGSGGHKPIMLSAIADAARLPSIKKIRSANLGDTIFKSIAFLFALALLLLTLGILYELWVRSALSREEFGWSFLWGTNWDPVQEQFGALPFIYGTLVTATLAILIAGPIGIGIAAYLVEIAPRRINRIMGFFVELLAAIPSVVYGLWGIFVLAPFLRERVAPHLETYLGWTRLFEGGFSGFSVFTASLILAIMILPTAASISRDVILAVPNDQREAMLALGSTRWEMFRNAVLPYAKSGIIGALVLALGRAAGETMAVTMIIGNAPRIFDSLFDQGATMASIIASQFANAGSAMFVSSLIELGMILFVITFIINVSARLLVRLVSRGPAGGFRA